MADAGATSQDRRRPPRATWRPPGDFDEYRIVRLLGRGGMGQVYLAHDRLLDRPVAIKFLSVADVGDVGRERFFIEARALARLQHPNVVTVYRVGQLDRRPFLVSEYVHGQSLERLPLPLPWQRVRELAVGLARGLAAAHRRGVLHRDIKPANTVLSSDDGQIKLLDFGLAKLDTPGAMIRGELPDATTSLGAASVSATSQLVRDPSLKVEVVVEGVTQEFQPAPVPGPPGLTDEGMVMGTPYYIPPEAWRGEAATARSDIYSLGVLLFELLVGTTPHADVPIPSLGTVLQDVRARPIAPLVPGIDARFADVVDRCLALEPTERWASAEQLREALEVLAGTQSMPPLALPGGNPYRGLAAFEAEHRATFFGRNAEIRGVIERLRFEPFVVVAGDAGVGKSSLCRAGVLPAIADGAFADTRRWQTATVVPGRRPIEALARVLAPLTGDTPEALIHAITDGAAVAHRLRTAASGIVLLVDQLEDLVTVAPPDEAVRVAAVLADIIDAGPSIRLLATVRGDYLTRIAAVPDLGDEIARAMYVLRPLAPDAMREAIVGPARAMGFTFESEAVVEHLVASSQRTDGGMPLLQFALAELWEARDEASRTIPAAALDAIGGVEGALTRHADNVIATLLPSQRASARGILTRLVTVDLHRARRAESELALVDRDAHAALAALVRGRLLIPREAGDEVSYELAHDALLTSWPTLTQWLLEQDEQRAIRQRLAHAATEWARADRPRDALLPARRLAEVEILDERELPEREREYVQLSHRARRRDRVVRSLAVVSGLALVVAIYGAARLVHDRETRARVDELLEEARDLSTAAHGVEAQLEALRQQAFARFDAHGDDAEAEQIWQRARAAATGLDRRYAEASERAEQALYLAGAQRDDVRAVMAELLYDRARLAALEHRDDVVEELLGRLAVNDPTGEWRRRWDEPGRVAIVIEPAPGHSTADARVTVRRVARSPHGFVLAEALPIGRTGGPVPPGPIVVAVEAPGQAPVTASLVVERGRDHTLRIPLLAAAQVPAGFAYVPSGDALVGTSDERLRRDYFAAAPQHRRHVAGFLIARTETTYADWIAFLEATPAPRRELHRPRAGVPGTQGAVSLEPGAHGWRLVLQPTTTAHVLAPGQRLVYRARARLRGHDWAQLPVSGVTLDDARAYAAWLARTGRVPGARLCTELEWERAARGADGRVFPDGSHALGDANYQLAYGAGPETQGPDQVGSHAATRSLFGIDDLAGNVAEWVEPATPGTPALLKGGSFRDSALACSASRRAVMPPGTRDLAIGVRVCADLTPRR